MTMQEERQRLGAKAAAIEFREESARQRAIYEEHKDELLAKYPEQCIAVCAGEFFPGRSGEEAMDRAERAHPDRAMFLHVHEPVYIVPDDDNVPSPRATPEFRAESARQRAIYEEHKDELLAKYPEQCIAVCAGEFFPGRSGEEAMDRAERAHPDRAMFLHVHEPVYIVPDDDFPPSTAR